MKILIYSLILVFIFQISLIAQPMKMRERLQTVKKVKLIEYMKLTDEKSNKLLVIVSKYQGKIDEMNEKVRDLNKTLEDNINELSTEQLQKYSNEISEGAKEISKLKSDKQKEIRALLGEKEFAKYQVFEYKFADALRKQIIKRVKERKKREH